MCLVRLFPSESVSNKNGRGKTTKAWLAMHCGQSFAPVRSNCHWLERTEATSGCQWRCRASIRCRPRQSWRDHQFRRMEADCRDRRLKNTTSSGSVWSAAEAHAWNARATAMKNFPDVEHWMHAILRWEYTAIVRHSVRRISTPEASPVGERMPRCLLHIIVFYYICILRLRSLMHPRFLPQSGECARRYSNLDGASANKFSS